MVLIFDDLRQYAVRRESRETQAVLLKPVLIGGIDLVAMAVAFRNFGRLAIDRRNPAAAPEHGRIGTEAHGAAEVTILRALLQLVSAQPFSHQTNDRLRCWPEFGGIGFRDTDEVAGCLDHRHLHAETDAEDRKSV